MFRFYVRFPPLDFFYLMYFLFKGHLLSPSNEEVAGGLDCRLPTWYPLRNRQMNFCQQIQTCGRNVPLFELLVSLCSLGRSAVTNTKASRIFIHTSYVRWILTDLFCGLRRCNSNAILGSELLSKNYSSKDESKNSRKRVSAPHDCSALHSTL
jgi:hypothetical protein